MMEEILDRAHVACGVTCDSKRHLFQAIAEQLAPTLGLNPHQIVDVVWEREQLGTTGVGQAIAIPHGKIPGLDRVCGYLAQLATPVDFASLDEKPVDLVFMLLAPAEAGADHLRALSAVSTLLRDGSFSQQARQAKNADALYALLVKEARLRAA